MPWHAEIACLWLALAVDLTLGEPPSKLHPVVGMGWLIAAFRRRAPTRGRWLPSLAGALFSLVGTAFIALLGWAIVRVLQELWLPLALVLEALILKTTFSLRALIGAGRQVRSALEAGDLPEARRLLSWHLVSRDTSQLSESQVAAATIESLAENSSDSFVAPLVYYAVGGLPAALAYRWINTCDAMLGYRDAEREWLGKAPARLDDLVNLLPARLTALLMIAGGALAGGKLWQGMRIWFRDARATASPNAGHPMSAAAGVLGIELEKVGHYTLGRGERLPEAGDIGRAGRLLGWVAFFTIGLLSLTLYAYGAWYARADS